MSSVTALDLLQCCMWMALSLAPTCLAFSAGWKDAMECIRTPDKPKSRAWQFVIAVFITGFGYIAAYVAGLKA